MAETDPLEALRTRARASGQHDPAARLTATDRARAAARADLERWTWAIDDAIGNGLTSTVIFRPAGRGPAPARRTWELDQDEVWSAEEIYMAYAEALQGLLGQPFYVYALRSDHPDNGAIESVQVSWRA